MASVMRQPLPPCPLGCATSFCCLRRRKENIEEVKCSRKPQAALLSEVTSIAGVVARTFGLGLELSGPIGFRWDEHLFHACRWWYRL